MSFSQSINPQRNPDIYQSIKLFPSDQASFINWGIKKMKYGSITNRYITPLISQNTTQTYIPNGLVVNGDIQANNVFLTGVLTTSDKRLKENIEDFDSNDDLFTLNPIIFSYKDDLHKKKHIGLLAQDVELVYPELVQTNDMGFKSVNYQELIPIMLSKMKQIQNEIDVLKEQIQK